MALYNSTNKITVAQPKKTRQVKSQNTKLSATARNSANKRYRGQGR